MEKLPRWQKFYTAARSDGIDKFHLCINNDLNMSQKSSSCKENLFQQSKKIWVRVTPFEDFICSGSK